MHQRTNETNHIAFNARLLNQFLFIPTNPSIILLVKIPFDGSGWMLVTKGDNFAFMQIK